MPTTPRTDYLVVGAGALGMAFVDALLDRSDAQVLMVDRRHRPGGHWLDAYPFVQLHQPSRYYGVDSTPLGRDRADPDAGQEGFLERATGAEICGYYDDVMRHRFLASGKVEFMPMTDYLGSGRLRSRVSGRETTIEARRGVVDATYMASRVPATEPPPFAIVRGVRCVPVGALVAVEEAPAGFVIIGGGKTATDAIGWLLDRGTEPDAITWIRPRDAWVLNREYFQPDRTRTLEGTALLLEAIAASATVHETYERLEADGLMLRTDRSIVPTMMKGATISVREVEQLQRVHDVVRLGHVVRIEHDRIVLEGGEIPTSRDHLHVHCAAQGLSDNVPTPIFRDDRITLQLVTRLGLTLSGALQGVVEASDRSTAEKNACCRPTAMPHTPFDYLRVILAGIETELTWQDADDLRHWMAGTRLNLLRDVGSDPAEREDVAALQGRVFEAVGLANARLAEFATSATDRERARMFATSGSG